MDMDKHAASKMYCAVLATIFLMTIFNAVAVSTPSYWFQSSGIFSVQNPTCELRVYRSFLVSALILNTIFSIIECLWVCCCPCSIRNIPLIRIFNVVGGFLGFLGSVLSFTQVPAEEVTPADAGAFGIIAMTFFFVIFVLTIFIMVYFDDWGGACPDAVVCNRHFLAIEVVKNIRENVRRFRVRLVQRVVQRVIPDRQPDHPRRRSLQ